MGAAAAAVEMEREIEGMGTEGEGWDCNCESRGVCVGKAEESRVETDWEMERASSSVDCVSAVEGGKRRKKDGRSKMQISRVGRGKDRNPSLPTGWVH